MAADHPEGRRFGLSKSRVTAFEQCHRRLWLMVHRPDLAAVDEAAQARIEAGHEVGELACSLVPGGVMVEATDGLASAARRTRELLEAGWSGPIFEATFEHDGVLVRVDVLTPSGDGWAIAEVKSTTGVKDYHLGDLATQVWVSSMSGLNVTSAAIRHIDNSFRLEREGDYVGLFCDVELLPAVSETVAGRANVVAAARELLARPEPRISRGTHCSKPFECGFARHCAASEPPAPEWPVALLPRTGKTVAEAWAAQGIFDLTEVPPGALTNATHERIREVTATGRTWHDVDAVVAATKGWAWPRAYLDFETIGPAIPRWIGTSPFQQTPFQFSCHVETEAGDLTHSAFLWLEPSDPRRACAEALVSLLGQERVGAIIAYNADVERRCVRGLAEACPDLAPELEVIAGRIVDLLPIARAHYYHRDQRGSWSIKKVLPTVAPELAYDGLEVGDGDAAQQAWLEAVRPETTEARRADIRTALEVYCERDTEAMVVLLRRLTGVVG
jgi:hypothetical protein